MEMAEVLVLAMVMVVVSQQQSLDKYEKWRKNEVIVMAFSKSDELGGEEEEEKEELKGRNME